MTNQKMIPGSENAFTFKTLADAFLLRNHIIERFERADVEPEPERKRRLLTFVIIGGGLVGVELFGELTAFVGRDRASLPARQPRRGPFPLAPGGRPDHAGNRREARGLRSPGARQARQGAEIRTHAACAVPSSRARSTCRTETIEAETIVLAAGIVPNPVVAGLPVEKDKRGHIVVDGTMRCKSHPEVWALGDCALIPAPDGKPYPNLAQHALREAKVLARNIHGVLNGRPPQPFVYNTLGMMGSLGHSRAFGQLLKIRVHGFLAWFVRRTYYLLQMPGWGRRLRIMMRLDLRAAVSAGHREDQPGQRDGLASPRSRGRCCPREQTNRGRTRVGPAVAGWRDRWPAIWTSVG